MLANMKSLVTIQVLAVASFLPIGNMALVSHPTTTQGQLDNNINNNNNPCSLQCSAAEPLSPLISSRRDWFLSTTTVSAAVATTTASQILLLPPETTTAWAETAIYSQEHVPRHNTAPVVTPKFPPKLAEEYYNIPAVTKPEAGQFYFPTLTPPFQHRSTFRYTLGRNAWALEQLLTFANVTATIRCNVIQLQQGGLWVHSPQWPTGEFCALLDEIPGPVEHVVLPCNAFEHKAPIKAFVKRYPNAKVWVAPGQYGPLGGCGTNLQDPSSLGYTIDGILGEDTSNNNPPPLWSDEFDMATLYVDLPKNAGPVSEVAFCHRPTKTLVSTDAVIYVPKEAPQILSTYFDQNTIQDVNFWPKSVLQAVFLPLRTDDEGKYPGYDALVDRLVRAPILRAVVDARAPVAVQQWIDQQTNGSWDFDRILTSHFASPIQATPADVRASFEYLFEEDVMKLQHRSSRLPPIACQDWELLDSINQFIARTDAGEKATFEFQRGCIQ